MSSKYEKMKVKDLMKKLNKKCIDDLKDKYDIGGNYIKKSILIRILEEEEPETEPDGSYEEMTIPELKKELHGRDISLDNLREKYNIKGYIKKSILINELKFLDENKNENKKPFYTIENMIQVKDYSNLSSEFVNTMISIPSNFDGSFMDPLCYYEYGEQEYEEVFLYIVENGDWKMINVEIRNEPYIFVHGFPGDNPYGMLLKKIDENKTIVITEFGETLDPVYLNNDKEIVDLFFNWYMEVTSGVDGYDKEYF